MKREYYSKKLGWMPVAACNEHREEYVDTKVNGKKWNPSLCCKKKHLKTKSCKKNKNYQKFLQREPGLF